MPDDAKKEPFKMEEQPHMVEFYAYATIGVVDINLGNLSLLLKRADDCLPYFDTQGKEYRLPPGQGYGQSCLPVLPWLWGRELNNLTMAYVYSLRPSSVRITQDKRTLDYQPWRVTIIVAPDAAGRCIIKEIAQEVEIGYGSGENIDRVNQHQQINTGQSSGKSTTLPKPGPTIGNTAGLERIDLE